MTTKLSIASWENLGRQDDLLLSVEERDRVEDWGRFVSISALQIIRQRRMVYEQFGLDWVWVRDAVRETDKDTERRNELNNGINVFQVLAKTLISAGFITDRTKQVYAEWVNMKPL